MGIGEVLTGSAWSGLRSRHRLSSLGCSCGLNRDDCAFSPCVGKGVAELFPWRTRGGGRGLAWRAAWWKRWAGFTPGEYRMRGNLVVCVMRR